MSESNVIDLMFGGLDKLGPGSDNDTLQVLAMLPRQTFDLIVDAGCGSGRHTLALANRIQSPVQAIDTHAPFLERLKQGARKAGIEHLVQTHCMDMADIPRTFADIDLLWSEGAAYNIGFSNALKTWHCAIKPGGFVVVSELSWLRENVPAEVKGFFNAAYPAMQSLDENLAVARGAGYQVLATHTLPLKTWVEGYYDTLEPRAHRLLDHPDPAVREFAAEMLEEIRIFNCAEGSHGYVFYLLQAAESVTQLIT